VPSALSSAYVKEHQYPNAHHAFVGQTPDEAYFGRVRTSLNERALLSEIF